MLLYKLNRCTNEQLELFVLNYTCCHHNIFTEDKFTHGHYIIYSKLKNKKELYGTRTTVAEMLQDIIY